MGQQVKELLVMQPLQEGNVLRHSGITTHVLKLNLTKGCRVKNQERRLSVFDKLFAQAVKY